MQAHERAGLSGGPLANPGRLDASRREVSTGLGGQRPCARRGKAGAGGAALALNLPPNRKLNNMFTCRKIGYAIWISGDPRVQASYTEQLCGAFAR
jgi:hypothetical protein